MLKSGSRLGGRGGVSNKLNVGEIELLDSTEGEQVNNNWYDEENGQKPNTIEIHRLLLAQRGTPVEVIINKKSSSMRSFITNWQRLTLPPITAVPSALAGLTSLFGMVRGGPRRNNHHKICNDMLVIDLIS